MIVDLFLRRAMITSVRREGVWIARMGAVLLVTAIVAASGVFWDRQGWDRRSVDGASSFALSAFGLIMVVQGLLAMAFAVRVAGVIASERDRKSLDSLLATRLSAAEIVRGAVATVVPTCGNWLAAPLPILVLVVVMGGVPPRVVWLSAAGIASSIVVVAALAVTNSVYAPSRSRAIAVGLGLLVAWIDLPLLAEFLLPRVWPGSPRPLNQVVRSLVDSSPAGVAVSAWIPMLVPRPYGLIEAIARMLALQVPVAFFLLVWSTWRLRPASRALYDGDWPTLTRWLWLAMGRRSIQRSPCGDDPVLWNEIHAQRGGSRAGLLVARLSALVGVGALAVGTSWFAVPAFAELAERGYGPLRAGFTMPEGNPFARVLIGRLLIPAGSALPGQARLEFNIALRQFSALFVMLYVVMICGTAATSIIAERERDTWLGLIATPLSGWEIIQAKMRAAIRRARPVALILIALWTAGLAAGALHPLGFLLAVIGLCSIGAFDAALGVALSLWVGDRKQLNKMILLVVLCLSPLSGLAIVLPGNNSLFLGSCSPPFLIWSSLFSLDDIQSVIHGGVLAQLDGTHIKPGATARLVLAASGIAILVHAAGAILLTYRTCRRFDALVGRADRAAITGS